MLDYQVQRAFVDEEGKPILFNPRRCLVNAITKVDRIQRFQRFKGFQFKDLLNYLKRTEYTQDNTRIEKADEMLSRIEARIKYRLNEVFEDPVDRM